MLQMTVEQLKSYNAESINDLLGLVRPILAHRLALYQRYARKINENEIMRGEKDESGKEKRIIPFEYYIVSMAQGYLGGKAPMYSVSIPSDFALKHSGRTATDDQKKQYVQDYSDALDYIQQYNDDAATFIELIHDYLITTAAYLYIYENDDNEIVYTRFDARQTVGIYDYSTPANLIGLVRAWKEKDQDGKEIDVAEIITDETRTVYRNGVQSESEPLQWGDVPAVAFDNPDSIAVFEPALSPIRTYEQITNNIANMTQYNDAAKLILKGYTFETMAMIPDPNDATQEIPNPARAVEERAIMNAISLAVGTDGDISWLLKDVNYDGLESVLKNQHDLITMLTGVPNMTDDAFSNADNASALGYKLYALDQYSATADRVFKKGLLRLWEVITNRLNLKGGQFDFRDIQIKLQRNIPTDIDKSLARATSAYGSGLVSQETALNISGLEIDAKEEMERQQAEQDADYEESLKRSKENPNSGDDGDGQDDGRQNGSRNAAGQKESA